MPICFLASGSVRRGRKPIGASARRCPGLLAIDHIMVAVAHGGVFQRSEVRAGAGSENPCAHHSYEICGARQEGALLPCEPKAAMTGPTISTLNCAAAARIELQLFQEDVVLDRGPALTAQLDRPARRRPALGVQNALRVTISSRETSSPSLYLRRISAEFVAEKIAHFARKAFSSSVKRRSMASAFVDNKAGRRLEHAQQSGLHKRKCDQQRARGRDEPANTVLGCGAADGIGQAVAYIDTSSLTGGLAIRQSRTPPSTLT